MRKTRIAGKSESTLSNYARQMAKLALFYRCSPELLDLEQVEEYLLHLKSKSTSESGFKHTVYGLRYLYRCLGMEEIRLALPSIPQDKPLPVVMNRREVHQVLHAAQLLKHRLVLGLLYDCGLRCAELCNLRISDLDFSRKMLHVRGGKGRKDRYLPVSPLLLRGLKSYLQNEIPSTWLFNGQPDAKGHPTPYAKRSLQYVVRRTVGACGFAKKITAHTFRHSFATHLLEDGMDIVSIKELLGHASIETTLVYLHVAQRRPKSTFTPLQKLYPDFEGRKR